MKHSHKLILFLLFFCYSLTTGINSLFNSGYLIHTDFAQNLNELWLRAKYAYSLFNFNGWAYENFLGFPIGMFHYVLPYLLAFVFSSFTNFETGIKLISILPSIAFIPLFILFLNSYLKNFKSSLKIIVGFLLATPIWMVINFHIWNLSQFGLGLGITLFLLCLLWFDKIYNYFIVHKSVNGIAIISFIATYFAILLAHPYVFILGFFYLLFHIVITEKFKLHKIIFQKWIYVLAGILLGLLVSIPYWYNLATLQDYMFPYYQNLPTSLNRIKGILFPLTNTMFLEINFLLGKIWAFIAVFSLISLYLVIYYLNFNKIVRDFSEKKYIKCTALISLFGLILFFYLNLHFKLPFTIPFITNQFDATRMMIVFWMALIINASTIIFDYWKNKSIYLLTLVFSVLIFNSIIIFNYRSLTTCTINKDFSDSFRMLQQTIVANTEKEDIIFIQSTEGNLSLTPVKSYTTDHLMASLSYKTERNCLGAYCMGWVYPNQKLGTSRGDNFFGTNLNIFKTNKDSFIRLVDRYKIKYFVLVNSQAKTFLSSMHEFSKIYSDNYFIMFRFDMPFTSGSIKPIFSDNTNKNIIIRNNASSDTLTLAMGYHPFWKIIDNNNSKIQPANDGLMQIIHPPKNSFQLKYINDFLLIKILFSISFVIYIILFLLLIFRKK